MVHPTLPIARDVCLVLVMKYELIFHVLLQASMAVVFKIASASGFWAMSTLPYNCTSSCTPILSLCSSQAKVAAVPCTWERVLLLAVWRRLPSDICTRNIEDRPTTHQDLKLLEPRSGRKPEKPLNLNHAKAPQPQKYWILGHSPPGR